MGGSPWALSGVDGRVGGIVKAKACVDWHVGKHRPTKKYHTPYVTRKLSALREIYGTVTDRFVPVVGFAEPVSVMPAREPFRFVLHL